MPRWFTAVNHASSFIKICHADAIFNYLARMCRACPRKSMRYQIRGLRHCGSVHACPPAVQLTPSQQFTQYIFFKYAEGGA